MQKNDKKEFESIIKDIIENEKVQEMKKYRQHFDTNTFDHCYMVSYYCYKICKKLNWDYKSITRAAMLHDFFLYDWREKNERKGLHAFTHGRIACENACKIFDLSEKEKDMIIKHMWPVSPKMPKSKEGIVLTFVDKYSTLAETVMAITKHLSKSVIGKYAYALLGFVVLKIHRGDN